MKKNNFSMIPRLIYCSFIFLLFSCDNNKAVNPVAKRDIIIDLQPFSGIRLSSTLYVFNELKKIYPYITLRKNIDLPQFAYYPPRGRYRADSLIFFLKNQTEKGHKTIGLTDKDISTTKNSIPDWGVMGLGYCPGDACIVSAFRLSKKETDMQLFKVAIHELGHTFGLPHCNIKSCFMRDAEGPNPTNEEKEFCSKCRSFLLSKGWDLK